MSEQSQSGIARRDLFRGATGIGLGALMGNYVLPPIGRAAENAVHDYTGLEAGNASFNNLAVQACGDSSTDDPCVRVFYDSPDIRHQSEFVAPIVEELINRAGPSVASDAVAYILHPDTSPNPLASLLVGRRNLNWSRRDTIVGIGSSLLFGFTHNFTSDKAGNITGFDAHIVPAAQIVGGMAFWGALQKFGIGSSLAMHMFNNRRVIDHIAGK